LDAAAVTGSEGVKVVMRGVATSAMVVVSRADTAFLAASGTTSGVMLLWRVADEEDAPLRGDELPSETFDGPATPAPRLGRPGEVDLVDVEALSEA
jgi:hypothetical protein